MSAAGPSRSLSSQQRRRMMKKVEHMVAEAERRVRARQEATHFSDDCSSDYEFFPKVGARAITVSSSTSEEEDCQRATTCLNSSKEEVHVSDVSDIEYDSSKEEVHVSDVSDIEYEERNASDLPIARSVEEAVNKSKVYSSGDDEESLQSLFRTPISEGMKIKQSFDQFEGYQRGSEDHDTTFLGGKKLDTVTESKRTLEFPEKNTAPQDRSVASKKSSLSTSTHFTPYQQYSSQPIISPPFKLSSPTKNRRKVTETKSGKARFTIHSPPISTRSSGTKNRQRQFSEMKKEIDDLTAEFAELEEKSRRRRARIGMKPEEKFDESVTHMEEKAEAMMNALHRGYNRRLKHPDSWKENICRDPKNKRLGNSKIHESNDQLLKNLDPSDAYVKRKYPSVPKTPGTMFTTEFIEVLSLDVGEHAYLAKIMDRQWGTTNDYRY